MNPDDPSSEFPDLTESYEPPPSSINSNAGGWGSVTLDGGDITDTSDGEGGGVPIGSPGQIVNSWGWDPSFGNEGWVWSWQWEGLLYFPAGFPVGSGSAASGGGTRTIKAAIAKLLKNPNCASLLGGLDKAEKILNQANLVDVSVPGFQPPNEVAKQISNDINNSNTIAEVSYQGNPCQGAIQCFFSPWSGTQFNVYYGAVYNDNSFSGEETLLMHEFMHVATQGTWAESVVDYVPQNQSWPVSITNIEKNCGTAEPVVPSKGGAE